MIPAYTISQIAQIIQGKLKENVVGCHIEYLLTDSRKLVESSTSLFFALDGLRRSGNKYIEELYHRGVRNFVVSISFNPSLFADANFIQVSDVLIALQKLTAYHRARFNIPLIGITGSNGKTIVKEWLNTLLEKEYTIVRSPKSYNSQIGVPLSVWQINDTHTLGIFEAGISQPGEMKFLADIIQPTIGILTHIGDAHSENFISIEQKIAEKIKLFAKVQWVVANGDDERVRSAILNAGLPYVFFGTAADNDIRVLSIEKKKNSTVIILKKKVEEGKEGTNNLQLNIELPFTDDASIENAISCCCVLIKLNYKNTIIADRILLLKPVGMRLEMRNGINNCSIINDSYINDLSSLRIALDFLDQQKQHNKKTVILSELVDTGIVPEKLYIEIASSLGKREITKFIGIGEKINVHKRIFEAVCKESVFYKSTDDYVAQFHSNSYRDETILVKGARSFAFERVINLLEQKAHQTVLEINLNTISQNLKKFQELLAPTVKIMVMVKAFSYGNGSFEVANILQFHKVDYLAVAYTDEGIELRKAGITLPIMVMNPELDSFGAITEHYLEPEIFSFYILRKFKDHLAEQGLSHYPVHIKIDTGMHRLGFDPDNRKELATLLSENMLLRVQSVFSHLSGSEDPSLDEFTEYQANQFLIVCRELEHSLSYPFLKHLANTAGIIRHKNLHLDMVRLGIGLYGVDSSGENIQGLTEAATLKTTIAQIKQVKAGDTVGYGRKGKITRDSRIATIRIGYADGYRRCLSNGNGYVLIHGKTAPVIGNIAMDMTMVDITDIPGVTEDDEVVIFGKDLPVTKLAQWANTIPYEIMTGISQRVLRLYYEE
ncbi:MAG: bifunctional UDP-N-acetylmuramoyl-tripeptide:D-alanyl-D-alanine ligase/alanine racemase [Bacteroidetes bacterium]|nr:bifunctional UDP-N-acetylmuramoyl-tripeptide:D-alanyl-D-alanine ligase/alanine racemase [Bacteroidota bacterium]